MNGCCSTNQMCHTAEQISWDTRWSTLPSQAGVFVSKCCGGEMRCFIHVPSWGSQLSEAAPQLRSHTLSAPLSSLLLPSSSQSLSQSTRHDYCHRVHAAPTIIFIKRITRNNLLALLKQKTHFHHICVSLTFHCQEKK